MRLPISLRRQSEKFHSTVSSREEPKGMALDLFSPVSSAFEFQYTLPSAFPGCSITSIQAAFPHPIR